MFFWRPSLFLGVKVPGVWKCYSALSGFCQDANHAVGFAPKYWVSLGCTYSTTACFRVDKVPDVRVNPDTVGKAACSRLDLVRSAACGMCNRGSGFTSSTVTWSRTGDTCVPHNDSLQHPVTTCLARSYHEAHEPGL